MENSESNIKCNKLLESFGSARTKALPVASLKLEQYLNPQLRRQKPVLGIFYGIDNKILGLGRPTNAVKHGEFVKWD